jgi:hypothetical protein
MALVRNDTNPGGKMNDFESTSSLFLPHDPISKKRTAGVKRGVAEISDTVGIEASSTAAKLAHGDTGVEFPFYERSEYGKLTNEQKVELREHGLACGGKKRKRFPQSLRARSGTKV